MIETIDAVNASPAGAGSSEQNRQQQHAATIETERRASRRFKAKPGSNVSYVEGAAAIRDLSMDDVFVLDSDPLEIGTPITFSVILGSETAAFHGIVRRSVAKEGMGIEFTEVSREMRRRLVAHVACIS